MTIKPFCKFVFWAVSVVSFTVEYIVRVRELVLYTVASSSTRHWMETVDQNNVNDNNGFVNKNDSINVND